MIHHTPKIMWIFLPGVIGASGTPTVYYLFGGKDIKEIRRKYGETINFGDLIMYDGGRYTTPIGVTGDDVCEFGNRGSSGRKNENCEKFATRYKHKKKMVGLKDGGYEIEQNGVTIDGDIAPGIEQIKIKSASNGKMIDKIWETFRRNINKGIQEGKRGGPKKCFKGNQTGIVFNWFHNGAELCADQTGRINGQNGEVLFEKTAGLIASNAMNLMDSAIRVSKTKNDLALRFVDNNGKIKEIFRLGFTKETGGEYDGTVVEKSGIKAFGEAHRKADPRLSGNEKVKTGRFGGDPDTKREIAFK